MIQKTYLKSLLSGKIELADQSAMQVGLQSKSRQGQSPAVVAAPSLCWGDGFCMLAGRPRYARLHLSGRQVNAERADRDPVDSAGEGKGWGSAWNRSAIWSEVQRFVSCHLSISPLIGFACYFDPGCQFVWLLKWRRAVGARRRSAVTRLPT